MKEIPYAKGYYIDIEGNVYSTKTGVPVKMNKIIRNGYYSTSLRPEPGVRVQKDVHRIVAEVFIPNPENKPEVNHKDGNKLNPNVTNLEWVTRKENNDHAIETGLTNNKGEQNSFNKYPKELIIEVAKLLEENKTLKEVSEITKLSVSLISAINNKRVWKDETKDFNLNPRIKSHFSKFKVFWILHLHSKGVKQKEIANKFKVRQSTVSEMCSGKRYKMYFQEYNNMKVQRLSRKGVDQKSDRNGEAPE